MVIPTEKNTTIEAMNPKIQLKETARYGFLKYLDMTNLSTIFPAAHIITATMVKNAHKTIIK
jgi:hypothetical protein